MKSENKKKSIFDVEALMAQNEGETLGEIEMVANAASEAGHVLSKNIELDDIYSSKNDMVELIKKGYNLPEVDEPEKMLSSHKEKRVSVELCDEALEDAPFRMVNLISNSYRLPDIETNDFAK